MPQRLIIILYLCIQIPWLINAQEFLDVTELAGLSPDHDDAGICLWAVGTGSAWADYDNDGDLDLYVTNQGAPSHLYRNDGDGNADGIPEFTDIAAVAGVGLDGLASHSAVFIDYDNDGDQDLYVTNWGGNTLLENQLVETGVAEFVDVTAISGLADGGKAITSSWADFDGDGWLDCYLSKHAWCADDPQSQDHLFKNNGDGTFSDVSDWLCPDSAPCDKLDGLGFSAGWFDYDNDGDQDLYLVNDNISGLYYPNVLWRNDGPSENGVWNFTDVSISSGSGFSVNGMGMGISDYNNDGWLDFAFSNIGPNYLVRNNKDGTFTDVGEIAGVRRDTLNGGFTSITWGTVFFDYDNDRWEDLYIVAGGVSAVILPQPNAMFRNLGDGTFEDKSIETGLDNGFRARNTSIADYNRDGFVDVFVSNIFEPALLYVNQPDSHQIQNNWLAVTVEGTISNKDAIGTRLWLTNEDGLTQMREVNSGPSHGGGDDRAAYFGLGDYSDGHLRVRWPSGVVEQIGSVQANRYIHLVEPEIANFAARLDVARRTIPSNGDSVSSKWTFTNPFAQDLTLSAYTTMATPYGDTRNVHRVNSVTAVPGDLSSKFIVPFNSADPAGTYILKTIWLNAVSADTLATTTLRLRKRQSVSGAIDQAKSDATPESFGLTNNYPNPFNPSTTLEYALAADAWVTLKVYDLNGREVATLLSAFQTTGTHSVIWNSQRDLRQAVASGVYIARMTIREADAQISGQSGAREIISTRRLHLIQ